MSTKGYGYPVFPHQCQVCGSARMTTTEGQPMPVFDLGENRLAVKRERIYVCGECIIGMATQVASDLGYVVKSEDWYLDISERADAYEVADAELRRLNTVLGDLAKFAEDAAG